MPDDGRSGRGVYLPRVRNRWVVAAGGVAERLAVLVRLIGQDQPRDRHVEEGFLVLEAMSCLRNFDAPSSTYTIKIRSAADAPGPGMSFDADL